MKRGAIFLKCVVAVLLGDILFRLGHLICFGIGLYLFCLMVL